MKVWKILLCGLLMALPVLAEETEDRQTATSLHYVTHELDTRQNKLSAGSNKALTYTNSAGNIEQRTVKANLTGGTTDTSLPMVNAVNAGLNTKQDDITTIDDHTAVTYTSQVGTIGQKGIYQDTGTYVEQSDNLIDAKTFNAALKNGLDNEFVCANRPDAYAPGTTNCWLWEIHNTYNAAAQPYVSATGTGVQNGTPTPTNPIYPTFYRQGNIVLRKVGDIADSYDATTHKITRRVGELILRGNESWWTQNTNGRLQFYIHFTDATPHNNTPTICSHFESILTSGSASIYNNQMALFCAGGDGTQPTKIPFEYDGISDITNWRTWLAEQYAAGTPVTMYYPLATPVEEDWSATTYNENVYIPQNQ